MIKVKKGNPLFYYLSWACKARHKENLRHDLSYLIIEKDRAWTTDTKRLHLVHDKVNLPDPGGYEVVRSTKSELWLLLQKDSPNIPDIDKALEGNGTEKDHKDITHGDLDEKAYAQILRTHQPCTNFFNFKYFCDAYGEVRMKTYYWPEGDKSLFLFGYNRSALLMPCINR